MAPRGDDAIRMRAMTFVCGWTYRCIICTSQRLPPSVAIPHHHRRISYRWRLPNHSEEITKTAEATTMDCNTRLPSLGVPSILQGSYQIIQRDYQDCVETINGLRRADRTRLAVPAVWDFCFFVLISSLHLDTHL